MSKQSATDKAIIEVYEQIKGINWSIVFAQNYIKEKQQLIRKLKKEKEPLSNELTRLKRVKDKL